MKKNFALLLLIMSVALCSCGQSQGVSQEEYDKVVAERDEYKLQLDLLKEEQAGEEIDTQPKETISQKKGEEVSSDYSEYTNFAKKIIGTLEEEGYVIEKGMFNDIRIKSNKEIGTDDLTFHDNNKGIYYHYINGCKLISGQYAFTNSTVYGDLCNLLIQAFTSDGNINIENILKTFDEEIQRSEIFVNDDCVCFLILNDLDFNFFIYDMDYNENITEEVRERYEIVTYDKYARPSIYKGKRFFVDAKVLSIQESISESYLIKKEVLLEDIDGDQYNLIFDFAYSPYSIEVGNQYTFFCTLNKDGYMDLDYIQVAE